MDQQDDKDAGIRRKRMKLNFEASVFEGNCRSQEEKIKKTETELVIARKKRDLLDAEIRNMESEIKKLENELVVNQEEAKKVRRKVDMLE